jgi:hypothetical protein
MKFTKREHSYIVFMVMIPARSHPQTPRPSSRKILFRQFLGFLLIYGLQFGGMVLAHHHRKMTKPTNNPKKTILAPLFVLFRHFT